jgi:hypothetical protein
MTLFTDGHGREVVPEAMGHLLTASLISTPGALLITALMCCPSARHRPHAPAWTHPHGDQDGAERTGRLSRPRALPAGCLERAQHGDHDLCPVRVREPGSLGILGGLGTMVPEWRAELIAVPMGGRCDANMDTLAFQVDLSIYRTRAASSRATWRKSKPAAKRSNFPAAPARARIPSNSSTSCAARSPICWKNCRRNCGRRKKPDC